MTTTITEVLHINCPTALAFDLMADVRHITRWNRGASKCEMKTNDPVRLGSRFVTVNRGQEMTSTITTYERPNRLDYTVTSKAMDVNGAFTFFETDNGTQLEIRFDADPKGIMKLLFPLLKPIIRHDLKTQHLKFGKFCETQNRSPELAVVA